MFSMQKRNSRKVSIKIQLKDFQIYIKFCDGDINKFVLLLRKGVYAYMDSWERFDETLPDKKELNSSVIWKTLQMSIIDMQKEYTKKFKEKI